MDMSNLFVNICYKSLLSNVIETLKIRKCGYGYTFEGPGLFRAFIEIDLNSPSNYNKRVVFGQASKHRIESEQDAAKKTIDYLSS